MRVEVRGKGGLVPVIKVQHTVYTDGRLTCIVHHRHGNRNLGHGA